MKSTPLLLLGMVLFCLSAGLFYWGASTELTAASGLADGEPMARIGQVAGAGAGVGIAVFVAGFIQRLRGK